VVEAIDTLNPIHRISVEQFHRMIAAGLFVDGDRVELMDGEMRDMTPIGPPHNSCTNTLNMVFASRLAGQAIVSVQGPLVLDDGTELYPDLTVLKPHRDRYRQANPTGDDAHLVIEVADTSLSLDLQVKLPKYAHAGIPRYWVVDIKDRTIHDYDDLDRFERRYRQLHSVTDGAVSFTLGDIEVRVELSELFPG
jgi:Uma2 family endonuclease